MKRLVILAVIVMVGLPSAILAQNNPPVLDPIGSKSIVEGENLNFTVSATDLDGTTPILYTFNTPLNASFTDNEDGTGVFDWTPDFTQAMDYDVIFYASDGIELDSEIVTITVIESGNHAPVLDSIGPKKVMEGTILEFGVRATDPDGGIPPELTASIGQTGNPYFIDNLNGTGIFHFEPDNSHIGDTIISFYASDGELSDTEVVVITVEENFPPQLLAIGPQSVIEGQTLIIDVISTDPNQGTTFFLTASPLPQNALWEVFDDSTGTFEFSPNYLQAGFYDVTFRVTDGNLESSEVVTIEVIEAGNQMPLMTQIGDQEVTEGDQLSFDFSVSDDDDSVFVFTSSSLPDNAVLTDNGDGTADFQFTPGCTQQGTYPIMFYVTDEQDGVDSQLVTVTVLDAGNFPPALDAIGPQSLKEGYSLEFNVFADDCEGEVNSIWIYPPADDTVYGGNLAFEDLGNGTAVFEFFPSYDLVEASQKIIRVKFFASDGIDVDSEEVVITVYDVQPDNQDPGLADTLVFESRQWNGQGDLAVTCYIWNDSAISGAITGFEWFDSMLVCDSVIVSEAIDSAYYYAVRIMNDSLLFDVEFIYYNYAYLDTGQSEYFTAWFHLEPGATWDTKSKIRFDTSSVGNNGQFIFDGTIKGPPPPKKVGTWNMEALFSMAAVYRPLIIMGQVRASLPSDAEDDRPPLPFDYSLSQNYPNPFNPSTTIKFTIPRRQRVQVRVYNVLGQEVAELADRDFDAGEYRLIWNGRDRSGRPAATGIYLYNLVTKGFTETRKMLLIK